MNWAKWLQEELDRRGWRQADLVRESQGHIKADRVSKWLSGKETPSHKLAVVTANTLDLPRPYVLSVAGFLDLVSPEETEATIYFTPPSDIQKALEAATSEQLLEELLRRERSESPAGAQRHAARQTNDRAVIPDEAQQSEYGLVSHPYTDETGELMDE